MFAKGTEDKFIYFAISLVFLFNRTDLPVRKLFVHFQQKIIQISKNTLFCNRNYKLVIFTILEVEVLTIRIKCFVYDGFSQISTPR